MAKSYRGTERAWATIRHSRCAKIRESNLTQKRVSRVGCSPGRGHPACCCCQAAPLRQGTHLLQLHQPPWLRCGLGMLSFKNRGILKKGGGMDWDIFYIFGN